MEPPPHHHRTVASITNLGVLWGTPEPLALVFFPQALLAVKSVPVDEDPETKVPMHPEDGAPQPGNSKVRGSLVRGVLRGGMRSG